MTACWWTSWADCPLLNMQLAEVTQWPRGPSATSPLRNNSALTSGNLSPSQRVWGHACRTPRMFLVFLSPAVDCISTTLQLWKYSSANSGASCAIQWTMERKKTCHWHCTGRSLVRQTVCNLSAVFVTHKKSTGLRRQTAASHTVN